MIEKNNIPTPARRDSSVASSADLLAARLALRSVPAQPLTKQALPRARGIFPARQIDSAWDVMDPCRVSPVWNVPPSLQSFDEKMLAAMKGRLAGIGHKCATLTPMLAGYSGAQPFALESEQGSFFVKAVMDSKNNEAQDKLAKEFVVGQALGPTQVAGKFIACEIVHPGTEPPFAFFVASLLPAKPLEAEPFRSELLALVKGQSPGPFLSELTRLLRGFHHAQAPNLVALGAWGRLPLQAFDKVIAQAASKNLLGGHERQALQAYQDRIIAAYALRGEHLAKNQVFAHGDMHASNVRWDATTERLVAIDFGDSGMGDPARELAYFLYMMDVPMDLAAPFVRLYQREVTAFPEAFYDRTLLALASERITRYVRILGWGGREKQAAKDYQRRIEDDLTFVSSWL